PREHQAAYGNVDVLLCDEPLGDGGGKRAVRGAALQVATVANAQRGRGLLRRLDLVALVDVVEGPAVGYDVAAEAPILPQDVLEQPRARRGRSAVHPVVGAHDRADLALLDEGAEGGEIRLEEV